MESNRLEAFSDGVLAIIITVMVLELKLPGDKDGHSFHAFFHTTGLPLLTYILSFVYIGIYWNNHHHMFQVVQRVDGLVLWANLHLLFWLSLYPLTTNWLDESKVARDPAVIYLLNLLGAALAYYLLQLAIMRRPSGREYAMVIGRDLKGKASPILYLSGIALTFVDPWLGLAPAVVVALLWLVPDRRVERWLEAHR